MSEEPVQAQSDNPALKRLLERSGVLDYRVLQVKAPPLVDKMTWQVKTNGCFVGIQFKAVAPPQKPLDRPPFQVWLLRADGTVIPQVSGPQGFTMISGSGIQIDGVSCQFPASAKGEACAVVISVGEEFFVERLSPGKK